MDKPVQLDTLYFTAAEEKEIFVINDIEVGVSPSDILMFDNNYVHEQTFVRSNSVFCYRSKYSETKVVLNFPFQITPQNLVASGEDLDNNTYNCIRLLTELNSYPFCFIKSPRLKTYVSPAMVSTTGYLMFAVEELAVVQSAVASNLLLLEVTLVYFNHAPLAADFQFVSNKVVTKAGVFTTSEGTIKTERDYLAYESPKVVSELVSSDVWADYINPKVDKAIDKLYDTGMYDQLMDSKSTHAGLDVNVFIPMVSSGIEHAAKYMADDDGKLLAPDAKLVVTTDMAPMDDLDLPNHLRATLDQNFDESRFENSVTEGLVDRKKVSDKSKTEATSIKTTDEIKKQEKAIEDITESKERAYGYKQVYVQYSKASFAQLGLSVQKIEVRRKNILAIQKIGSYKHPIVQFMGKMAAQTTIQFLNNSDGVYSEYDEDSGIASFLTNAFQILDENRSLYPEIEAYNTLKIHSLASFLLNAESSVPNINNLTASADRNGIETMIYHFAETNIEDLFNSAKLEASGAKSISKARSEVYGIILTWLKEFHRQLSNSNKEGIYHFANMHHDKEVVEASLDIYRDIIRVTMAGMRDLGLDSLKGDAAVIKTITEQLSDGDITISNGAKSKKYAYVSPSTRILSSGLSLYTDAANSPVSYFDPEYRVQTLTLTNFHKWFSSYAIQILQAKLDQMDGKPIKLANVTINPVPDSVFETLSTTIINKLGSTPEVIPFGNSLSESQKFFIKNMADTYIGSLYGQNLPDLKLEDLEEDYDVEKDVVIQNTDPFFFLSTDPLISDEMLMFFTDSYEEEQLNSKALEVNEDAATVKQMSSIETMLGANYRKIEEVDFNESDWASNPAETGIVTIWRGSVNLKPSKKVSEAIEYALSVHGRSGDEELRQYMYKTAHIESSLGTNLIKGSYKGLYQFGVDATAEVLKRNNRAYASKGYVNMSHDRAVATAEKLWSTYDFMYDFKTSAVLFLDSLFLVLGGKKSHPRTGSFDMAYTYAGHQQGPGGQQSVGVYLRTGVSPPVTGKTKEYLESNYSSSWSGWYNATAKKFNALAPYADAPGVDKAKQTSLKKQDALTKQSTSPSTAPITIASARNGTLKTGQTVVGKVTRAVDGDTLDIQYLVDGKSIIQRIRVAGLDTPETSRDNPKFNPKTYKYALQAKEEMAKLVGKQVSVSITGVENDTSYYDVTPDTKVRLIGSVTTVDNTNVALDMIEKGLGDVNTLYASNQQYSSALEAAQRSKTGMWAELPANKKEAQKYQPRIQNKPEFVGETGNNFQPFANGQKFRESSPFTYGKPRKDLPRSSPHNGIDLASPKSTTVIAAASGIASFRVASGYGYLVEIDHQNGFKTRYAHLSKSFIGKKPQKVNAHQPIGLSGGIPGDVGAGSSTDAHLHYEVHYKGKPIHPFTTKQTLDKYSEGVMAEGDFSSYPQTMDNSGLRTTPSFNPRSGITEENTVYNEHHLAEAIIDNAKKYINTGMKTALPAIKVYIVIGNENDGLGLSSSLTGVQYYELNGIQSFKMVCNNDNNPSDVAVMQVINPSFMHTDSWTNQAPPGIDLTKVGTDLETQLLKSRMLLRVGTKLQVRLGYGNDPNELETVFNGGIIEVANGENNQIMTLVLESYGRELLQEIINPTAPEQSPQVSTSSIIGKALQSRSIDHFGASNNIIKWFFKNTTGEDPEQRTLVPRIDITGRGGFINWFSASTYSSRLYMNIFAPEIENIDNTYSSLLSSMIDGLGWSNKQMFPTFFIYQATPWSICKQMEYRHPGTIFKPLIFEDRVTPFYGIKEQMYFARDLSTYTQMQVKAKLTDRVRDKQVQDYYSRRRERMKPVSNIHMVSSSTNLISNSIKLNAEWKTSVNVSWFDDSEDFNQYWDWETQRMDIDDNLLPWEIREKEVKMSGIHGKYASFMYGTEALKKEAETMYGGTILITGNPTVKAGDYIFIDDADNRISGLCLVRDCIHHFDPQFGFVTEITPGLYVEPAAFMYSALWIKLMCTFKVGSSKIRLNTSSGYSSQYNLIKEYLDLMQQLVASGDNPSLSNYDKVDSQLLMLSYSTAITLSAYMGWSLSRFLSVGSTPIFNKKGLVRFSLATMRGLFHAGTNRVFNAKLAKLRSIDRVSRTISYASGKYNTTKSTIIASKAFRRAAASRPASALKAVQGSWIYQLTAGATKGGAKILLKGVTRSSMALVHGFAMSNPVTLLLDIALTLVVSWAFAKVEENKLTRQPLMFFPLINHGKPYVAGMLGAVRNSLLESKKLEIDKTMNQLSKGMGAIAANNAVKGEESSLPVRILSKKAKESDIEKSFAMSKKPVTKNVTKEEVQAMFDKNKDTVEQPFK